MLKMAYKFSLYAKKSRKAYDDKAVDVHWASSLIEAKKFFEAKGYVGEYIILNNNTGQRMQIILKDFKKEQ